MARRASHSTRAPRSSERRNAQPQPQSRTPARKPAPAAEAAPRAQGAYARIYRTVARIPRGRIATYGQIAELAGLPRSARQVGYALAALNDAFSGVPWHRVVNARGEISARFEPTFEALQRELLSREGVRFDAHGRVSLERFLWRPDAGPVSGAALRVKSAARAKAEGTRPVTPPGRGPQAKRSARPAKRRANSHGAGRGHARARGGWRIR
jgi:methylated-DNA-protein-cysteine methyltransferase-like protein